MRWCSVKNPDEKSRHDLDDDPSQPEQGSGDGESRDTSPEVNMGTVETREPASILGQALTRRERVVLGELAEDVTLEEIAQRLFVTRNTVKSQVRSVYRKVGVSTRAEAVAWARAHGIQ